MLAARARPARPTTAGYPRASSSRNVIALGSAAQQTQPTRSAAKLPETDHLISMNSLSISEVPSRGPGNARPQIRDQNYFPTVMSSQQLKPSFQHDPVNRFQHDAPAVGKSRITDDSGSRYGGMKTAMSSKDILKPSNMQSTNTIARASMAEKSVESSVRKGDKLITLDQNLSASDLHSVSPHQKVERAGKTGQSPHFHTKLAAPGSVTASPYKFIAPDLDRYKILDTSFDVVQETRLNHTASDVPNVFLPKEKGRAKSAVGRTGVRASGRRRLQSAKPKRLRQLGAAASQANLREDTAGGMSLKDVARFYSAKSGATKDKHYIKDYFMHKPKDKHLFRGKDLVRLQPPRKEEQGYLTAMVRRAKAVPSCTKYSKILNWGREAGTRSALPQSERVTIFREIALNAKGKPGPTTYKAGPSKDKACLRNTTNFFTSKNDKITITQCQVYEKSFVPPCVRKQDIHYQLTEKREPFLAHLKTMVGRETREEGGANGLSRIKKTRKPGPASYSTEKGFQKLSTTERVPITQFSGLGMCMGPRPDLKHVDKLKAKSNRFLDQVLAQAKKKTLGPGNYKLLDKGFERQSSKPRELRRTRVL